MSIQYVLASDGKEYRSTYIGRKYHIDEKIKIDPRLRKRIPKRWLTNEWVIEVDKDERNSI